jgi:hypothetical protein
MNSCAIVLTFGSHSTVYQRDFCGREAMHAFPSRIEIVACIEVITGCLHDIAFSSCRSRPRVLFADDRNLTQSTVVTCALHFFGLRFRHQSTRSLASIPAAHWNAKSMNSPKDASCPAKGQSPFNRLFSADWSPLKRSEASGEVMACQYLLRFAMDRSIWRLVRSWSAMREPDEIQPPTLSEVVFGFLPAERH